MKSNVRVLGYGGQEMNKGRAATEAQDAEVAIDDKPKSVYEMMTRQMLLELKDSVGEVKGRVNTLLWLVVGAILLDLVMRLVR
ncbi:MAG TPA: hypothetical protein VEX13_10050 [Chloroflexia bacterium]|nr:hypothetical protein [Chloroflexia bacterium]